MFHFPLICLLTFLKSTYKLSPLKVVSCFIAVSVEELHFAHVVLEVRVLHKGAALVAQVRAHPRRVPARARIQKHAKLVKVNALAFPADLAQVFLEIEALCTQPRTYHHVDRELELLLDYLNQCALLDEAFLVRQAAQGHKGI